MPPGQASATFAATTVSSPTLAAVLENYGTEAVLKAYPEFSLADTIAISRTGQMVRAIDRSDIYILRIPLSGVIEDLVSDLLQLNEVVFAEPNAIVRQPTTTICHYNAVTCPQGPHTIECPTDPYFPQQNNLYEGGSYCDDDIGVVGAWQYTRGSTNTKIVIIDTGISRTHPDLPANRILGDTGIVPAPGGTFYSHGTSVAGIIAARTDNGNGIAGIDWHAQLIAKLAWDE